MGTKNYLIEGISGTGKTTICDELIQRGYQAIHGDRVLAYQGDPITGKPLSGSGHIHHIWDVDKVKKLVTDQDPAVSFLCGGSRNFEKFIHYFDQVFVLEVDLDTLLSRLKQRPLNEWGGQEIEREFIVKLHHSKEDIPKNAIVIDSTQSIETVVNEILTYIKM